MRMEIDTIMGRYICLLNTQGARRIIPPGVAETGWDDGGGVPPDAKTRELAALLAEELPQYCLGRLREFTVPIWIPQSWVSPFRRRVYEEIRKIPYGETLSYGELARRSGTTSGRALGATCSANPLPLLVPCHRVIATNGTIGGYIGGKNMKRQLLELEKRYKLEAVVA